MNTTDKQKACDELSAKLIDCLVANRTSYVDGITALGGAATYLIRERWGERAADNYEAVIHAYLDKQLSLLTN